MSYGYLGHADRVRGVADFTKVGAVMSAKHTPGPWLIDDKIEPFAVYEDDSAGRSISLMGTPSLPPRPKEVTLANMHLIAAAPDLLAALKNILANGGMSEAEWISTKDYNAAKDAIAKAEPR